METSESGSPIYRYEAPKQNGYQPVSGEPSIDEISEHIEKYVGEIDLVFHELVSEHVHIDIHWVKPTKERPFHTLVTSGMSDIPMSTPEGIEGCDFAELSICLPEDWDLTNETWDESNNGLKDEKNYWPIRWLKVLARFPHIYNTWLSHGHTIPNGDPAEAFAENTELNTMLLLPSVVFDEGFHTLELKNKSVDFYALIPLYSEEVDLKMKKGVEALFDGFDKFDVSDILQIDRPNTAKRKRFFGLF